MNIVATRQFARRGVAASGATIALAFIALIALAPSARGAEFLYWDNYDASTIGVANLDGSGASVVNTTGITIDGPEGMAYDPVTNRLFLANAGGGPLKNGQINFINLDGSGAGVFSAPGAPVENPEGIALDPVARTVYWVNHGERDSLAWAKLDGSAGGVLNTAGATFDGPDRLALDPGAGRIYWVEDGVDKVAFARVDNSGGGELPITGASPPINVQGIAVDTAAGRLYWVDFTQKRISSISLAGGDGADLDIAGAPIEEPYGLALDPTARRIYWANYGTEDKGIEAFGFAALAGGGTAINLPAGMADGPQDPVIIKSPAGVAAPVVTKGAKSKRSELTCSNGTWAPDFPGSVVYQAPTRFSRQWTRNGAPVPGATAATLRATAPGRYACVVTASNHAGSAIQASAAALDVKAAKFKLTARKTVKAAPGGVAKLKVKVANQGDLEARRPKLCVKVPRKAKQDLKAPKCKSLGSVDSSGKRSATLRVRVGPGATGTYKLKVLARGAPGKAAQVTLQVR